MLIMALLLNVEGFFGKLWKVIYVNDENIYKQVLENHGKLWKMGTEELLPKKLTMPISVTN